MTEQELIDKYYSSKLYLSFSGLSKAMYSPMFYYNYYVLGQREDKTEAHLIEGSLIHCLLLEPQNFAEKFYISTNKIPGENTKKIIDTLFRENPTMTDLDHYHLEILNKLVNMNLHQSLKTDEQRIAKVITEDAKEYLKSLIDSKNKIVIDQTMYDSANVSAELMKNDPLIRESLYMDKTEFDNIESYTEYPFMIDIPNTSFGLKGIVDKVIIDHDKKLYCIRDIKTTGKTISEFSESVEYYNYWAQIALYCILVRQHFGLEYGYDCQFIVIDKYKQKYVFDVSPLTLVQWSLKLNEELEKFEWYYTNKDFTLPYEFKKKRVIL